MVFRGNTALAIGAEVEEVHASAEWDELVRRHLGARCIVPLWDELAGWKARQFAFRRSGEMSGGFMLSVRRVPFTPISFSRINCLMLDPQGPLESLDALLEHLERFCRKHLIVETELRLRVPATRGIAGFEDSRELRDSLMEWGYAPLSKIDATYLMDVDRSDDAILASFNASTRSKIRKALRAGATVAPSHDYSLLDDFYTAYEEMCERKGFGLESEDIIATGLRPLLEAGRALLFVERYPEGIGNMVIVDALGVPCYQLGTRSSANVRGEVRGAAQFVQYEIMKAMRDRGSSLYDLGGCEGPEPIEGHPNYGVWRFKHGFRGQFVRFLPFMRRTRAALQHPLHVLHAVRGDPV